MVFRDRAEAARRLAERLEPFRGEDLVILAIPRGGVVIGDGIARAIGGQLDVVVPRKLGAPYDPELAIGAVMHDGSVFLNEDVIEALGVPEEYIEKEKAAQMKEIERRLILYRGHREYRLEGRTVLLVDDGVATGATLLVAARWVRTQAPKKLVIAVPVGPPETIEKLQAVADEVVALLIPAQFGAVGEFYRDFSPVTDEEVRRIMRQYGYGV
ncbi:Putative phosphoribosyl transferase [bacterium HR11]|nr:Putative phosphoribosyl transferase [bacterium HR11]